MSDYIDETFGPGGHLARMLAGYEPRPGQIALARAVDRAIRDGENVLAEAPTGTGKSLAYSVPAIHHALDGGERSLIVTANIALQEQLVRKDLPLLREALPTPFEFALAKGRSNYLCLDRLDDARADEMFAEPLPPDDEERWRAIVEWAGETLTGDLSELPFEPAAALRQRFTTTAEDCLGKACARHAECHANAARARLDQASVIVTNYHLLFAHIVVEEATEGNVSILPPFDVVVFDEGHKAADIAREFFGFRLTAGAIRWAARLLSPPAKAARKKAPTPEIDAALKDRLVRLGSRFFDQLADHARSDDYRARLKRERVAPHEELCLALADASAAYEKAAALPELEGAARRKLRMSAERCEAISLGVERAMTLADARDVVYFLEETTGRHGGVALVGRPVEVKDRLREKLFASDDVRSVAVTSATLTSGGSFDFLACELGAEDATELVADSPFDFSTQALLVVPVGLPDPRDRGYVEAAAEAASRVVEMARGRTLGLFTSYRALEAAHARVSADHGFVYRVMRQGEAPRTQLIQAFRDDVSSVLLGTESLWSGVDVPGESLSCVVIDKLPFPPPDDPILDAMEERDRNAFRNHVMPRAIIAFRQGFGRLIRTVRDRGVVVCLDARLADKGYGKAFLKSLPAGVRLSRDLDDVGAFLEGRIGRAPNTGVRRAADPFSCEVDAGPRRIARGGRGRAAAAKGE